MRLTLSLLLTTAALALPSGAATVTETGDFSSDWFNPTAIAAGTSQVSGIASDLDVLLMSGLKAGAQTLSFGFSGAGLYSSGNLTAGGAILYSYTPFQWGWDNDGMTNYQVSYNSWNVGTPWFGHSGSLTSTASLTLNETFLGTLYLAIVPWNSTPLAYTVDLPVAAAAQPQPQPAPMPEPSAVPVPAAGLMLGLGLAGLVAGRRRKAA
jgi:hypothetical protein